MSAFIALAALRVKELTLEFNLRAMEQKNVLNSLAISRRSSTILPSIMNEAFILDFDLPLS